MDHVAALTKGSQLVKSAVTRIVVEVRTGQDHRCPPAISENVLGWSLYPSTVAIAPVLTASVPPSPIAKVEHLLPMRTSAMLASSPCPDEAHKVRELRPVNWIQEDVLRADRHEVQIRSALAGAVELIVPTRTRRVRDKE